VIVLDASVLIAHFEASDAHHERATQLLVDAAEESLGASPLTLAEVLVGPARTGKLDDARTAIRELEIATVALAEDAPVRLAALRAGTRLRLPDCCVLLAAGTADGAEVATFDARLAAAAADLGVAVRS
jgi:predicted nucleic acid-binding protein